MIIHPLKMCTDNAGQEQSLFLFLSDKMQQMPKYGHSISKCKCKMPRCAVALALNTQKSVRFGTALNAQTVTQSNMVWSMVAVLSPSNLTGKPTSETIY